MTVSGDKLNRCSNNFRISFLVLVVFSILCLCFMHDEFLQFYNGLSNFRYGFHYPSTNLTISSTQYLLDNSSNPEEVTTTSSLAKPRTSLSKENDIPLILIWKRPFGNPRYGPHSNVHCGCNFTYDRTAALTSDAVVIYCRDAIRSNLPPDFPNRSSDQMYVWWCLEPPTHILQWNIDLSYRNGFFNWTMTYRRDSDIVTPWGMSEDMKSIHKKANISLSELMKRKKKLAIAVVSNCGMASGVDGAKFRLSLIQKLEKFLPIEGYGSCFGRRLESEVVTEIMSYKFFMAFENSYHCKDYITEKFWNNAMLAGAVPVVWGTSKEDYEAVAPKSSFIFAEDFETLQELATYLQYLDRNDTAYLEYFQWRSLDNLSNLTQNPISPPLRHDFGHACSLCRKLLQRKRNHDSSKSIVESVQKYFYGSNGKGCIDRPDKQEVLWRYGNA